MTDPALGAAPVFSVLVAAYQSADTIAETLDSLITQDFAAWEAIVVDDGSTDGTAAVAEGYARSDRRIRVIRQPNAGTAAARNAAAAVARGRWLLPLDADDVLVPEALSTHGAFIDAHPGFELYSWSSDRLLPDGAREPFDDTPEYATETEFVLSDMLRHNRLLSYTTIDAALFARLGGFRDVYIEDYDLWLRAMAAGARHIHDPRSLAVYRYRVDGKNSDVERSLEGTALILRDLAASPGLPAGVAAEATSRAAEFEGIVARSRLEEAMAAGRFAGVRRGYWRARRAYTSPLKRWVGVVAVAISPRLLAALLGVGRKAAGAGGDPELGAGTGASDGPPSSSGGTRVSIVIPNWNGVQHLEECFAALTEQTFRAFEVIVVDNASSDASVEWVERSQPSTRIIRRGDNGGFSKAVNEGIRASSAEYVALLNNDTRAEATWLEELVRALDVQPDYDLAASRMMLYFEDDRVNSAGDFYDVALMAGRNRGLAQPSARYLEPQRVLGACAGAALYRRTVFDEIGLFDEDFFLMSEDTDLNLRALIAGKKCLYVPSAVVRHKLRASIESEPQERMALLADRNEAMVFAKDMPWPVIALAPMLWVYRTFRKTIPLRPSLWERAPILVRRLPGRIRAERQGFAMGWRKRAAVSGTRRVGVLTIIRWLLHGSGPLK
jgi:GT2 family glycosyltransferase